MGCLALLGAGPGAVVAGVAGSTLDPAFLAANTALSNGNLTATRSSTNANNSVRGTKIIPATGACWEITFSNIASANNLTCGVIDSTLSSADRIGDDAGGHSGGIYLGPGKYYQAGTGSLGAAGPVTNGQTIICCYTPNSKIFHIWIPGLGWDTGGGGDPTADTGGQTFSGMGSTVYAGISLFTAGDAATINFGATSFVNPVQIAQCTAGGRGPLL